MFKVKAVNPGHKTKQNTDSHTSMTKLHPSSFGISAEIERDIDSRAREDFKARELSRKLYHEPEQKAIVVNNPRSAIDSHYTCITVQCVLSTLAP